MAHSSVPGEVDGIVGINVTPLVDIILVILIVFMVSAELVKTQGIVVEKPAATTGAAITGSLQITLTTDRTLYIDGTAVAGPAAAAKVLRDRVASDPAVAATIVADTRIAYGEVVEIIDLARSAGIRDFSIAVQPADAAK